MDRLRQLYIETFAHEPLQVIPITGSASNRQYYRLTGAESSCVGVVGTDARENAAFIYMARHFASKGIRVPEIISVSEDGMAYLQSDLGSVSLFDRYAAAVKAGEGVADVEELLCRTMAALPKIQFEGADGLDFPDFALDVRAGDLYALLQGTPLRFDFEKHAYIQKN